MSINMPYCPLLQSLEFQTMVWAFAAVNGLIIPCLPSYLLLIYVLFHIVLRIYSFRFAFIFYFKTISKYI